MSETTRRSEIVFKRRKALKAIAASGIGCLGCLPATLWAGALRHDLKATQVADNTYVVYGEIENFNMTNGGNIVNTAFVDTADGVVLIDTGPSFRYAQQLKELIAETTAKPVVRVYMTHHHPDHMLGNQVFAPETIAAMPEMIANMAAEGDGFSDNMYRLVGDWMRGTELVLPATTIDGDSESIGGHTFRFIPLAGHTSSDLVIVDEHSGVMFGGDLAFFNRAPTTPHADLDVWQDALTKVDNISHSLLVPGHGPVDDKRAAVGQTREYLSWLQTTLTTAVDHGFSMTEAMALPIDQKFAQLGVVEEEFQRSVAHLYAGIEEAQMPVMPFLK